MKVGDKLGIIRNFFSKFIRARPITNSKVSLQTISTPSVFTMRSDLYDIPEIRTAVQKTANHFARIKFNHIKRDNTTGDYKKIRDNFHYCLNVRANVLQTAFDFKQKLATLFYLGQDVFINPHWEIERARPSLLGLEIIDYYGYEVGVTTPSMDIVIKFYLKNGRTEMYYFRDLIFIQRFPQGLNPVNSQNNKQTIKDWLTVATGIKNAILKASNKTGDISIIVLTEQNLKEEHYKKKIEEINEQVESSKNGIVFIGGSTSKEVMTTNPNVNQPNPKLVDDIIDNIYRFYDTNKKIVKGEANDIEFEQYVDSAIKPLAEKVEQELTYAFFSRESIDKGNSIMANMVDVQVSTLSAKTAYFKEMAYAGILLIDEVREELGKPPLLDGLGKVPMTNKNTQAIKAMLGGGEESDSKKTDDGDPKDSDEGGQAGGEDD
mgnify:CR=1 FL=1